MNEEKKKINTGIEYKNSKYRPSVMIDKCYQTEIESRIAELNCKSFNEYVKILIEKDMNIRL